MIRKPLKSLNPMSWAFKATPKQIYNCIEAKESEFFSERKDAHNKAAPIHDLMTGSVSINRKKTMISENGEIESQCCIVWLVNLYQPTLFGVKCGLRGL